MDAIHVLVKHRNEGIYLSEDVTAEIRDRVNGLALSRTDRDLIDVILEIYE
jgi:hypothetical protein